MLLFASLKKVQLHYELGCAVVNECNWTAFMIYYNPLQGLNTCPTTAKAHQSTRKPGRLCFLCQHNYQKKPLLGSSRNLLFVCTENAAAQPKVRVALVLISVCSFSGISLLLNIFPFPGKGKRSEESMTEEGCQKANLTQKTSEWETRDGKVHKSAIETRLLCQISDWLGSIMGFYTFQLLIGCLMSFQLLIGCNGVLVQQQCHPADTGESSQPEGDQMLFRSKP